jgi:cysteine desulfurase family protein (TIGR01976 family)
MFDVYEIRKLFPALQEEFGGLPATFFDNPGGTQVPQPVIGAMVDYLTRRNANSHGAFVTSRRTDEVIAAAREAAADLLNADPTEIVFGANMTTLTFHLARALAPEFRAGDEIIVTKLDHDANISPWVRLAQLSGATVRYVEINMDNCTLDMEDLQDLINPRTKLVAVGYASNATGTINDVKTICQWAKSVNALTFVDAVQYAAHGSIDVKDLNCDFLACSAYKFFGPHVGVLYGKQGHLARLKVDKVRPAEDQGPERWETGTKNHEGLAGLAAAVEYLAELGDRAARLPSDASRRAQLLAAFDAIQIYEQSLAERLLSGLQLISRARVYGISGRLDLSKRVATVSIRKEGTTPQQMADALAAENIFAWHGNFYAQTLSETLGVEASGGLLRLGLVHYNTYEEVDRCLRVLERV